MLLIIVEGRRLPGAGCWGGDPGTDLIFAGLRDC